MEHPSYLIHYNKNHSKANGQFVSGDGDGDGQVNDRAARKAQKEKDRAKLKATRKKIINEQKSAWQKKSKGEKALTILGVAGVAATIAGTGAAMVIDYRKEKLADAAREEQIRQARERVDRWRASKAKFVGGDW